MELAEHKVEWACEPAVEVIADGLDAAGVGRLASLAFEVEVVDTPVREQQTDEGPMSVRDTVVRLRRLVVGVVMIVVDDRLAGRQRAGWPIGHVLERDPAPQGAEGHFELRCRRQVGKAGIAGQRKPAARDQRGPVASRTSPPTAPPAGTPAAPSGPRCTGGPHRSMLTTSAPGAPPSGTPSRTPSRS